MMHVGPELRRISGARVLDIGSGDGEFTALLIGRGNSVYAVDIANFGIATRYPDVRFQQADARYLPFRAESFDFVLCSDVLEHIERFEPVISEISRVLEPGGRCVISTVEGYWESPLKVRRFMLSRLPLRARRALLGRFCQSDEELPGAFLGHVRYDIAPTLLEGLFSQARMRTLKMKTYCHAAGSLLMELFFSFNERLRYLLFPFLRLLLPLDKYVERGKYWQFYFLLERMG